jgi:hypothetical protein
MCPARGSQRGSRIWRHTTTKPQGTEPLTDDRQRQALLNELRAQPWVVYAKSPMAGPAQVLGYLSRYTHRVAVSNERLLSMDEHYAAEIVKIREKRPDIRVVV